MEDIERGARAIVKQVNHEPHISTQLLRAWRKDEEAFQRFFDSFQGISLRSLSDEKLLALFRTYYRLGIARFTSSVIIDHFALGTDTLIADMLRKELGNLGSESIFTDIVSGLTAPVHQSFINAAELELLRIALASAVQHPRLLARCQARYFWIRNNYVDVHVLTARDFAKDLAVLLKSKADARKQYARIYATPRLNAERKKKLLQKYHLSPLLRRLLKISEDFTWWQDERKKATYLNIHMGAQILGEMARRRGIDPEYTKYLVLPEVEHWFIKGTPSLAMLRQRRKSCAFVVTTKGFRFFTGSDVEKLHKRMFPPTQRDMVNDVRGLTASTGKVVGRVKIVSSVRDIGKMQQGNILVSVMTRPDYIAGIKKAAAIVTNEGGITCHAAIISRELGIPCIIGTKIATEVFKDGDLVEVNANHGVVTRILHV
ncbi:hypothetical protein HY624_01505 [Candidatus Uhrbacteria bacterium]|nr:hypothetical protein [Candidatus Uhrbacteria bacterium]